MRLRLLLVPALVLSVTGLVAQSSSPKPNIPDFPGSTSTTPQAPPPQAPPRSTVAPPDPTALAESAPASVQAEPPSMQEGARPQAKTLTKAQEKDLRKKQKEDEKKKKEAEAEKTFLKLQGDDIVAPTLDADGKPIHLAPCSKKDKVCQKKRKAILKRKTVGMKLLNGTLTVDGWTGKARLNYDISEVKFLYFFAPGIGTVVVSNQNFPGAQEQKNALQGKTLGVTTPDKAHFVQLAGDNPLTKTKGVSMWVALDTGFVLPGAKYPSFGYGSTAKAPYNWPGARPMTEQEKKLSARAPALPKGLEAKEMEMPCLNVKPGETIKPVKLNGVTYTPKPCKSLSATPALAAGERPPDGSGAASTGIPEEAITKKKQ